MFRQLWYFIIFIFSCVSLLAQENLSYKNSSGWNTFFELSGYKGTSSYDQTLQYFQKFENKFPEVRIINFGKSPQGRDLYCVIVSKDMAFTPEEVKLTRKPVVMINSGIHGGEIEGKDASMLLLRDILVTGEKKYLLDSLTILLVPIFNVDGHERKSRYNRINQDGPDETGWRTTSQNLNLNRDWIKADSPEMKSMLKLFNAWLPDFFIDSHTSDGADYQYTVTVSLEKYRNIYNGTAVWNKYSLLPYLTKGVTEQGFLISPYVYFKNDMPDSGLVEFPAPARFSTGYAALQNRPALLIETHMMKPYKERVFSTLAVLNTLLQYVYENPGKLLFLNAEADRKSIDGFFFQKKYLPVSFKTTSVKKEFLYMGIEALQDTSFISGRMKTVYTGKKYERMIPYYDSADVVDSIICPKAFLIPKEWSSLVEILDLHGIKSYPLPEAGEYKVKRFKFKKVKFSQNSNEGRQNVDFEYDTYYEKTVVPAGTVFVPAEQRTIRVILHLLHPQSEDSFVKWGFMNSIFERKEYFEDYVMEREAEKMLKADQDLKREFEEKLSSDKEFRDNPYQRLNFFYERSPYFDKNYRVYPVMLIE